MRLCLSRKRLFHAQFDLAANGHTDHTQWKADWQKARTDPFLVLGSHLETASF